jgi:hypothetical protein
MQKFTDFIKENKTVVESLNKASKEREFESLFEAKLKELGANSILDLDENNLEKFNEYVKTIKEDLTKKGSKKENKKSEDEVIVKGNNDKVIIKEAEVTDEKSFREYALEVLQKAHPKDFDQKIADKVIDDLAGKVKDGDWGAAVGRLTSGLGK